MNTLKVTRMFKQKKNNDPRTRLKGKIQRALDQRKREGDLVLNLFSRIPDVHRKVNEEAYTPQLISIGPFHYRSPKLQSRENYKLRCLEDFLRRANKELEDLVSTVLCFQPSVRMLYERTIEIESDDFINMILVDACFIIEFFLRDLSELKNWTFDDSIELKPWMISRMKLDLILLENQLPFNIIERLYEELPHESRPKYGSNFLELAFNFFKAHNLQKIPPGEIGKDAVFHFIDLLRHFNLPHHRNLHERSYGNVVGKMYCASQLAEAGLKFKPILGGSLLDLRFKEGVLEIPCFPLDNTTEIYARNIMAWEQCHYPDEAYVTDYFIMLDFLINTGKDVDLLVQEGVLVKGPGTNSRTTLPTNLCSGISHWGINDYYYGICRQLVEFRKRRWYVILKSSLKRDYFRTPWMGAATVGAIILLILTLIQTICTVISIFK
ncbi:hypothetical protein I3760_16G096700 [Carya illinoinensis]|uniref:Uncharacterized protein n=1 Tax=Carya illinoinensis TaxID=32201 RepID=A0A8T1N8B9_CARIL|nr:UPF0481 protein At3g47200-like [Carya illinoinensis]XP_042964344.1 UPF0481 protein At3g47200-like [Carya illinoinensis]KAG2664715.1 hypothetical protein I3760_16G096700 [Carya illinoinensis]KAG6625420.1 hypothetical protein CIPAW_16G095700 [Carya illinoinensis]